MPRLVQMVYEKKVVYPLYLPIKIPFTTSRPLKHDLYSGQRHTHFIFLYLEELFDDL
jgi:hypothetical protein